MGKPERRRVAFEPRQPLQQSYVGGLRQQRRKQSIFLGTRRLDLVEPCNLRYAANGMDASSHPGPFIDPPKGVPPCKEVKPAGLKQSIARSMSGTISAAPYHDCVAEVVDWFPPHRFLVGLQHQWWSGSIDGG